MNINFVNNSSLNVEIEMMDSDEKVIVHSNNSCDIKCNKAEGFYVREIPCKTPRIGKVLCGILAFFVSIFLWLVEYFDSNSDSFEQSVKFDAFFEIEKDDLNDKNEIIITDSEKRFVAFDAVLNKTQLKSSPEFTEQKLKQEIKDYRKSEMIVCIFPVLVFLALFIYSCVIKQPIVGVIAISVIVLLIVLKCKQMRKSQTKINELTDKIKNTKANGK